MKRTKEKDFTGDSRLSLEAIFDTTTLKKANFVKKDFDKDPEKIGWKSILLLQFQRQFTLSIILGILFCYAVVIYEASQALAVMENEEALAAYMTDTKGIVYSFDAFYFVDILLMICYKSAEWPGVSHRYHARNALILLIEGASLIPADVIYFIVSRNKRPSVTSLLRLRYVIRLIRLIYDQRKPTAMTKQQSVLRVTSQFLVVITLAVTTIAVIMHPYMCNLRCPLNSTNYFYQNLYVATEKITGKGFGHVYFHDLVLDEITEYVLTIVSFFSYIALGYATSRMVCTFISRDLHIYSFLIKYTKIKEDLAAWKKKNQSTWKNYDESLYTTIQTYYQMIWDKKRWYLSRVFKEEILPKIMFKDIYLDMSWSALKHSHLFKFQEVHFLRELANSMSHTVFAPGEIIYGRYREKSCMVYIVTGIVQILSAENGETPVISLSGGTCLGESSLVIDYQSSWTVVCKTYCEVTLLEKKDFIKISLIYPSIFRKLTTDIKHRYKMAKRMQSVYAYQWERADITNPNTLSMMWIKRSLHQLIESHNSQLDKISVWNEGYSFCAKYLDMLVITGDIELVTDKIFLKKKFPVIFQPESIFLDGWNVFVAFAATIVMILYPCYMIFCTKLELTTHLLILTSVTIIWCTDIYIQSSTAVRTKDALLSNISSIIYYRLTNSAFLLDIFSAFPFSVFLNSINNQIPYETLLLAEAHKLFKIHRLQFIFGKMENLRFLNKVILKYFKVLMIDFFLCYYTATVFYYIMCAENGCPKKYMEILDLLRKEDATKSNILLHLYCLAALFLGNITYVDFFEFISISKMPIIITLQFIYTFFGIFTVSFAAISETLRESKVHEFKEYVSTMDVVMVDFNISPDLQKRIRFYLKDHFWMDRGLSVLEPELLRNNMSPNLYAITKQVLYGKFLYGVELFKNLDDPIVFQVSRCMISTHYPQGEVITYAGEVCKEMHVIQFGFCRIQGEQKILSAGDTFCMIETCLEVPTFFTVITLTDCEILSITYKDYAKLTAMFPTFKHSIERALNESIQPEDLHRIANKYTTSDDVVLEPDAKTPLVRKFKFGGNRFQESRRMYLMEFDSLKCMFRFILLPYTFPTYGRFVLYWEISRIALAFCSNLMVSLINICVECKLNYVLLCLDFTAWLDIYWRQHVCYYNELGIEVSHPMRTAIYYWKHGFLVDLTASFPIDYLFSDNMKPYVRINRILQLHRLVSFVRYLDNNSTSRSKLLHLGKYIPLTLLLLNYLSTLGLYGTCESGSWMTKTTCISELWAHQHLKDSDVTNRVKHHMGSLMVTTISGTMIGFTRLTFMSIKEIFNSCVMNVGGHLVFVWLTARTVANNFYRKTDLTEYQEAMKLLLLFVNYRKIDRNIKREIIDYFEYMWKKSKGKNLVHLLTPFSTAIKEDILYDMFGKSMSTSSIFSKAPKSFFKSLFLEAKYEVYIHKGIIYHVNDVHGFIFVLLKGHVEILGPDFNKLLILSAGSVFGNLDNCLMSRQTLTLVAKGHVEVLKIETIYFHSVLSKYDYVLNRFKRLTTLNVDYLENLQKMQTSSAMPSPSEIRRHRSPWYSACYLRVTKIVAENVFTRACKITIMIICCFCGFHLEMYQFGSYEADPFFVATLYTLDVLYLVKIYLQFHIAYIDDTGLPVNNRFDIARNYIQQKLGFYFDLAAVVPLEVISLAFVTRPSFRAVWSWLRKNRLIRIILVLYFLKSSQEKLHVNVKIVRIIYTITWITLVVQTMGALMLYYRLLNYTETISTEEKVSLLIETYRLIIYTVSGASLTNLNTPFTMYIAVNSVILMLVCKLFIILFISETCSMLENVNQSKNKYRLFTLYLKYQVKEEDVSVPLRKRIGEYLNLLWTHNRGIQFPRLLNEAPYYLKEAILNAMYGFHLRKHPLMMHCHTDLIRQMAATFDVIIFFPGNYVTYVGDVDGCMYFIHKGEVSSLIEDHVYSETYVDTLVTGDWFGLDQGLYKNCCHNYTYKVLQHSVILALDRGKWIHLLDFYPASRRVLFELRDMYMYK